MKRLAVVIVIFLVINACAVIEQDVSPKEQAVSHLNAREFHEAISILMRLNQENPDDDEIKILLASAYAGSTGLNIIDSFHVFKPLIFKEEKDKSGISENDFNLVDSESLADVETAVDPEVEARLKMKKSMVRLFDSLSDGFAIIFSMPYSEAVERRKLVEALLILKQIPAHSSYYVKANHYMVLLNLTQFLNYTKDAFPDTKFTEGDRASHLLCNFKPSIFFRNTESSFSYLISGINSFEIVRKDLEKEMSPKLVSLKDSVTQINKYYLEKQNSMLIFDLVYAQLNQSHCP